MHVWFTNGILFGNWLTDHAVVQACCDRTACATLYAPTAIACVRPIFEFVLPLLVRHRILDDEQARRAIDAPREAFRPEAASPFERREFETLRAEFERMGERSSGEEQKGT